MSITPADDPSRLRAARPAWVPRPPPAPVDPALASELVERLRGAPERAARITAGLDDDVQRFRATPEGWSLREHVGHLADLEPLWLRRTHELLADADALSPADVRNPRTRAARFHERPAQQLVALFRARRAAWTAWLAQLAPEDFARSAHHARLDAPFTLAQHCLFVANHDDDHLAELRHLARTAPGGLRVRPLRAEEWPRFVELSRAWIETHWQLEPADRALFDAGLPRDAHAPHGPRFLAAERGAHVVGVVALLPVPDAARAAWVAAGAVDAPTCELAKLAVDPSARGLGVGAALVEALLGEAAARGGRQVVLGTARVLTPAIALYERFGFEHLTGPADDCEDLARCDLFMRLDLGAWP